MRKRIRLTGRKQLARSSVTTSVLDTGSRKVIALTIADQRIFTAFPRDARIKLRLYENKFADTLEFGTIGSPNATANLNSTVFSAPSCQLRIVASENENRGLLLGSTDSWTLRTASEEPGDGADEGILMFQPFDIAPRVWKLDIREDDYPIVYIDKSIPNARAWVRNDPVFSSAVLPAIIRQIFEDILYDNSEPDIQWMKDWLRWADTLTPGRKPPYTDGRLQKQQWIEDLIDTFSRRHSLIDRLQKHLLQEVEVV